MRESIPTMIRVLLDLDRSENDLMWVAQCLEFDISAQGRTIDEARAAFRHLVKRRFDLFEKFGHESPFQGLPEAPPEVWQKFDRATELGKRVSEFDSPIVDWPEGLGELKAFIAA